MKVKDLIDQIYDDLGEPKTGKGFWDRPDVIVAVSYIQQQITRITYNLRVKSGLIEPAANDRIITLDTEGNLLQIDEVIRLETTETPIFVFTKTQLAHHDYKWYTRTGSLIKGLISDEGDEGQCGIFPEVDNANNDLIVWYYMQARQITTEKEITVNGDSATQLATWSFSGLSLTNTDVYRLYWSLSDTAGTRTVSIYKGDGKASADLVAQGTGADGVITLAAQNGSGLTGSVTVTYTADDSDSLNTIDLAYIQIPVSDIPCLKNGTKALMLTMESSGKDLNKSKFYQGMYGYREDGVHVGNLADIIKRVDTRKRPTFDVMRKRVEVDEDYMPMRPLYPWEG